jgi:hypothetical protein
MDFDPRLVRLRALVDRLERLPASERREWMLEEARARMVDVETGFEPRPMRTRDEESPATRPEPPLPAASNGHAVKRARPEPKPVTAPRRRSQPEAPTLVVPLPVPEPAPPRTAGPDPSAATLGDGELLWLEDRPGHTVAVSGNGSAEIAQWKRGLRG